VPICCRAPRLGNFTLLTNRRDVRRSAKTATAEGLWSSVGDAIQAKLYAWSCSIELLEPTREEIQRLAEKHGAYNLRVFGSFARGEAGPHSDLDLLIAVGPATTPWFPGGLVADLERCNGTGATPQGAAPRNCPVIRQSACHRCRNGKGSAGRSFILCPNVLKYLASSTISPSHDNVLDV
jgi:predicted nucleotidyltransferase